MTRRTFCVGSLKDRPSTGSEHMRQNTISVTPNYPKPWEISRSPPSTSPALERRESLLTIELVAMSPELLSFPDQWWDLTIERHGYQWSLRDSSKNRATYKRGKPLDTG